MSKKYKLQEQILREHGDYPTCSWSLDDTWMLPSYEEDYDIWRMYGPGGPEDFAMKDGKMNDEVEIEIGEIYEVVLQDSALLGCSVDVDVDGGYLYNPSTAEQIRIAPGDRLMALTGPIFIVDNSPNEKGGFDGYKFLFGEKIIFTDNFVKRMVKKVVA